MTRKTFVHVQYICNLLSSLVSIWFIQSVDAELKDMDGQLYVAADRLEESRSPCLSCCVQAISLGLVSLESAFQFLLFSH